MKLHSLHVKNVRGLRDLDLHPNGDNILIWGPNGSGKSGVVDAIGFLFFGCITRLTGEGTGSITLGRHGHHVLSSASEAKVSALVDFQEGSGIVEISRGMASPQEITFPSEVSYSLDQAVQLAMKGQMCLTRRDLLRFIAAEGRSRAQQIQELLNLTAVEGTRQALVSAQNQLKDAERAASSAVTQTRSQLVELMPSGRLDHDELRTEVNSRRKLLGGADLTNVSTDNLFEELSHVHTEESAVMFNSTVLNSALGSLQSFANDTAVEERTVAEKELRASLDELSSDGLLQTALKQFDLISRGLDLVNEDTLVCPMCDAEWPPGKLIQHLREEQNKANKAETLRSHITTAATALSAPLAVTIDHISSATSEINRAPDGSFLESDRILFSEWSSGLQKLVESLKIPEDHFLKIVPDPASFESQCVPPNVMECLGSLETCASAVATLENPEVLARDWLTRLDERLRNYEDATKRKETATTLAERGTALELAYLTARDSVLDELYGRVSDRFVQVYKRLHPQDSPNFNATIEPTGSGLNLEVSFDDGAMYPANAVHSEGHQDSMGLCLFLALHEELAPNTSSLIVLDDIVMSLDSGHRRHICTLLKEEFSSRQFVITTHDKGWARQLQGMNVVQGSNSIRFSSWSLHSGPMVQSRLSIWEDVNTALNREDVETAAATLRRHCEEFFESVCDALVAKIDYNSAYLWDLSSYLLPAMDRYRSLVTLAKKAAKSWESTQVVSKLEELDRARSQAYANIHENWWTVNSTVHFDKWVELEASELRPIVEAFKALERLFECQSCKNLLAVATVSRKPTSLKCPCGDTNLNLEIRP